MPNPNHHANDHPPAFDVEFAVTPDDKVNPVVDFDELDGLPHPSGEGLTTAKMAVEDHGPGILDVPDSSGLLDA